MFRYLRSLRWSDGKCCFFLNIFEWSRIWWIEGFLARHPLLIYFAWKQKWGEIFKPQHHLLHSQRVTMHSSLKLIQICLELTRWGFEFATTSYKTNTYIRSENLQKLWKAFLWELRVEAKIMIVKFSQDRKFRDQQSLVWSFREGSAATVPYSWITGCCYLSVSLLVRFFDSFPSPYLSNYSIPLPFSITLELWWEGAVVWWPFFPFQSCTAAKEDTLSRATFGYSEFPKQHLSTTTSSLLAAKYLGC